MGKRILIVEDEKNIVDILSFNLVKEGYETLEAYDGEAGLQLALEQDPDLILLDLMLPRMNGFDVCRSLRERGHGTPVIMLTAREEETDKVLGLELWADDCVTKPFSLAVLRARVNNLLRRGAVPRGEVVELPPFSFDFAGMAFSRNGEAIELSKTEQRLLRLLVEHRGQTLTREQLLDRVWDGGEFVDENALSVAVRRLRAKLGDAPIKTVYGLGYTWEIQ